jgi:hypothetical protein
MCAENIFSGGDLLGEEVSSRQSMAGLNSDCLQCAGGLLRSFMQILEPDVLRRLNVQLQLLDFRTASEYSGAMTAGKTKSDRRSTARYLRVASHWSPNRKFETPHPHAKSGFILFDH